MLKTKTYKYRLCPTKKQIQKLEWTLDKCRILYNSCLLDRRRYYEQTGKSLSRIRQQEILKTDKQNLEFLNDIHSQVLQDVLFRVDKSFQSFFRRIKAGEKAGYPRFKGEGRWDSITYPQQPSFQITEQGLKLSKIGVVKIKMHRSIQGTVKICVIKKESERWYACFSVQYEPVQKPISERAIGIDVGVKSFATLSNGSTIDNPRYLIKSEQLLKSKQRQLSNKIKDSSNRKKVIIKVARLHTKVRNQRSDFHHKIAHNLVNKYGFIAVEDLNIKGMVKNHNLAKHISDAGWGQFFRYLQYKAVDAGVQVVRTRPHYSSIECSNCGNYVYKTVAVRVHACPFCNITLDRDHNSAVIHLKRATAGTAGSNAWGEGWLQPSLNQEALSVRTG
jgi:putative transposase